MIFGIFRSEKKRVSEMIKAARDGDTRKIEQLLLKGADINSAEPESGDTPLLAAIDNCQWAAAELLLKFHPDLSLEDKNGNSPLYLAVSQGDKALPTVNQLLEANASIDLGPLQGSNAGTTPLHIACAIGANGCLESLLRHGASSTKKLPGGATPMHTAAVGGDKKTIKLLIHAGASVNALNNEERTPLHNCGITGNLKAAEALILQGALVDIVDAEGCTPLMHAVMKNHAAVVKFLLDRGADPDVIVRAESTSFYPLFVAASNGYDDVVRVLLDRGVNVNANLDGVPSPLDAAEYNGHEASAKLIKAALQSKEAAVRDGQRTVKAIDAAWKKIVVAITQRDTDGLRKLSGAKHFSSLPAESRLLVGCVLDDIDLTRSMLQAGSDCNKHFPEIFNGITPLVAAVSLSRSLEVAQLLLDAGADVNQALITGVTPIFETTADQYLELAKLLVNRGANVNVQLANGLTPLICATRNAAANCVDLFLDAGADINAVASEHGIGAFGWALNRLDLKLAEHLFTLGAEPNFGSIDTMPLAIAEHGSLAFVQALEERGCKLVREDQRGRIAFISARNPDPEVFDYFINHGADPIEGNDLGYTPLILAALNNRPTLIRRYLERGEDASVRDIDGETALSLALEKRHDQAIEVLREFHVEEKDYSALALDDAMLKAAEDGALGTILNLRDQGISINTRDEEGNSPMMLAVKAGHVGVVRSLYHLGADINHRNQREETALSLAKASDATDIINSLQEFGGLTGTLSEHGKLSNLFGGIALFNVGDTMFGRTSHPYKETPPYDNTDFDNEANSDDEADDEQSDDADDNLSGQLGANASIEEKLDLLAQVLESEQVKEQMPEAMLEQLSEKLGEWLLMHEMSGLGDDELDELNSILDLFDLDDEESEEPKRTPIFDAVHAQDLGAVKKFIQGGADINEVDAEGNTALIVAILAGEEKLVNGLLKLGADINKARPDGVGPLFASVVTGQDKLAQLMVNSGAEVDARFSIKHNGIPVWGCTSLYGAAFVGQVSACKMLLDKGAQLDAANDIGYTPLMAAIEGGHDVVIEFLLKMGANADTEAAARMHVEGLVGTSPLICAIRKENLAVVKKLLKNGAEVNRSGENGWTPLKKAAQLGNLDIVKALLDAGADPNIADNTNYTPLMNAVSGEHEDIVRLLLKFHADPNVQCGQMQGDDDSYSGRTALMDAVISGNVNIARDLLKQGANPNLLNSKGRTALHSAVISTNTEMVSMLLKAGVDPDVYGNDNERLSALDLALHRWVSEDEDERVGGVSDVLEMMLKLGKPDNLESLNLTALELVSEGHLEVVELLRKQGVVIDPDYSTNGASQLFYAAALGDERIEAAEFFLKIGADANFKNPAGLSVLSLAVRSGATKITQALLAAGADVMDRNGGRVLAYDLAGIYGHDELAEMLIAQMNRVVPEVDRQDSDGNTALMRAVKASDANAISNLLEKNADSSRRDRHGESPLSYAVLHDLKDVVRLLREAGVERIEVDASSSEERIVSASHRGALGTILDLLDSGISIEASNAKGDNALTSAIVHPGVVKVLAKMGADLSFRNQDGNTAYMIAAASSRVLMMSALAEVGSPIDESIELDPLSQMQTMLNAVRSEAESNEFDDSDTDLEVNPGDELLMAALTGDAVAVSTCLSTGADVNHENDEGKNALLMALIGFLRGGLSLRRERDFLQIIDSLIAAGANPKMGSISSLILGVMTGRVHIVNALIRAGTDIDAANELPSDEEGGTMLANALIVSLSPNERKFQISEGVSLALVEAGIDLSFSTDDGSMAIHLAAETGMVKTLREIIHRAPETINVQDSKGMTPLMLAASMKRLDAIGLLLANQADQLICDTNGRTAAEIAAAMGYQLADSGFIK